MNLHSFNLSKMQSYIDSRDSDGLKNYISEFGLEIRDGKILPTQHDLKQWKEYADFYDKRQLVRKILLNSTYGALLNEHMRFFDKRIGQSVTLSGRQIVRHMMSHINQQVCGDYDYTGPAIVYGDTDSCYFSAHATFKSEIERGEIEWNKDVAITLYDHIAEQTNGSFPDFMYRAFHAPQKNGAIIKAGRELIGDRALFITKKRYAINIYDKENKRLDIGGKRGKIKAMGLDLKRSDTPKYVQAFLSEMLDMLLAGGTRDDVVHRIKDFKRELAKKSSWQKGSPKSANKLTYYGELLERDSDAKMPGHIRASLNWNWLRRAHGDNYSMKIVDGMKIIVCKLRPNALGYTSIAYPTDELRLPEWFTSLPFDDDAMHYALVDKKVDNLLGVLDWNLIEKTQVTETFDDMFTFG